MMYYSATFADIMATTSTISSDQSISPGVPLMVDSGQGASMSSQMPFIQNVSDDYTYLWTRRFLPDTRSTNLYV